MLRVGATGTNNNNMRNKEDVSELNIFVFISKGIIIFPECAFYKNHIEVTDISVWTVSCLMFLHVALQTLRPYQHYTVPV
jgi:hypothetical protein